MAHGVIRRMFISWEPPIPTFLKINFDSSVMGTYGKMGFVIKGLDSRLVAAGDYHLFGPPVSEVELQVAWISIVYVRLTFRVDRLLIEDDSFIIVGWIKSRARNAAIQSLLYDIDILLESYLVVNSICLS